MNQSSKPIQKMKQRDLEQQLLLSQSWKSNEYMGRKKEKSNIAGKNYHFE